MCLAGDVLPFEISMISSKFSSLLLFIGGYTRRWSFRSAAWSHVRSLLSLSWLHAIPTSGHWHLLPVLASLSHSLHLRCHWHLLVLLSNLSLSCISGPCLSYRFEIRPASHSCVSRPCFQWRFPLLLVFKRRVFGEVTFVLVSSDTSSLSTLLASVLRL